MKAFLMHKDRDFDMQGELPSNAQALIQDLELNTLFNAMALGDKFLFEVTRRAILNGLNNAQDTILFRQDILKDCLKNPSIVRYLYDIAVGAIEGEHKVYGVFFTKYPASLLSRSIEVLQIFSGVLKKLRSIADEHAGSFESKGFTAFFSMLKRELGDEYFAKVEDHLTALKFSGGVLISAELGKGNKGTNYVLRKLPYKKQSWLERIIVDYILPRLQDSKHTWLKRIFAQETPAYTFSLHPRDDAGARALSELRDRGINLVANTLAQSADHILGFFKMLQTELAFYIGCLNLHGQLVRMEEPIAFPLPAPLYDHRHSYKELYDVCLALTMKQKVVGNSGNAYNKDLVLITGANQGGKSTFLRSIGLAQLMMQCGMFVPAEFFSSNICDRLFTHYKREEDIALESGKLDEELGRMSDSVDNITPNSLLLLNESFAATNEREGSEIAGLIVSALVEKRIKIFYVTHLYELARSFYDKGTESTLFLRAERKADGQRTFKVIEGEPLQTSFGKDLYARIFGNA